VDRQRLLVMEFVDGVDLSLLVRRAGPLPITDACEIIRQAALGLQSAHNCGLVHRDIKPSNLMLSNLPSPSGRGGGGEGVVKVLDLGLALIHELPTSQEEVTACGQALGTAEYSAPEQITDSHEVDGRADIYSLGCTLYKLLTGQAPFDGPQYASRKAKMAAHVLSEVPDVRRLRRDVPAELAELLACMAAKSSSARFASMADVADGLAPFCAGHNLPALLKRAEGGTAQSAVDAQTDEFRSSGVVSTSGQHIHLAPRDGAELAEGGKHLAERDKCAGRKRRLLLLGTMAAGVLLAAFLIVRWRDSTGREVTVETSEPSRVTIDKSGTISIVPMQSGAGPKTADSENSAAEPVALKDFFKDVPGRWVLALTSEKDLASCQIDGPSPGYPATGGVTFQSNIVEIDNRVVFLSSFKSSVQGIRAKVKWVGEAGDLCLRRGPEGFWMAYFYRGGWMGMGRLIRQNEKGAWTDLRGGLTPAKRRDRFAPIGFAAIGDHLVCEVDGDSRFTVTDNRVSFGSPGIGAQKGSHAFFKDIEVFVPDKDFAAKPKATSPAASTGEITNSVSEPSSPHRDDLGFRVVTE